MGWLVRVGSVSAAADVDGGNCRRRLFVGQLPSSVSEHQLRQLFDKFGRIIQLKIRRDYETGHCTCYSSSLLVKITLLDLVINRFFTKICPEHSIFVV